MTRWRRAGSARPAWCSGRHPARPAPARRSPHPGAPHRMDRTPKSATIGSRRARRESAVPGAGRRAGLPGRRPGQPARSHRGIHPLLTPRPAGAARFAASAGRDALEALAEGYVSSYRYREAARAYDDLEQHFARYQGHDVADDAALARTAEKASGVPMFMRGLSPVDRVRRQRSSGCSSRSTPAHRAPTSRCGPSTCFDSIAGRGRRGRSKAAAPGAPSAQER